MGTTAPHILRRRGVLAWCLYDAGDSAFVTSIVTVLLPIFFGGLFPPGGAASLGRWHTSSDALWGYASALYMLLAALAGPVLGAMADARGHKRRFLGVCAAVGVVATAALGLVGPGQYLLCIALYVIAGFFWSAGNVFYDGFLPDLADSPAEMDTLSSVGYAFGYLGGGLVLAASLLLIVCHARLGLASPVAAVRLSFVLAAAWWGAFTLPLLLRGRERTAVRPPGPPVRGAIREGFVRVARTLARLRRLPELTKFLVAFLLYNTGIGTVIVVVARFAESELALSYEQIVGCLLMVQFVAMPAALLFIVLARRIGSRNSIFAGLAVFTAVVVCSTGLRTAGQFYALGVAVALVLGGTQAISRSVYGSMIPPGMSAEFYGFFSIFNKVGTFVGPLAFGLARDLTGTSRSAILVLAAFFVAGFGLLATVRIGRGVEQAKAYAGE